MSQTRLILEDFISQGWYKTDMTFEQYKALREMEW